MNESFVQLEIIDGRAQVTLNRVDKSNALSTEMLLILEKVFLEVASDTSVHAVLLTGAGEKAFSAGADLGEPETMKNEALWQRVYDAMVELPVPSIALINGACIGGGMMLALGCDIRIGVNAAVFGYPVLKNGVLPGPKEIMRIRSILGYGKSAMLLLGGERVSAKTAMDWGFLDRIVSPEALLREGIKLSATACDVQREQVVSLKRRFTCSAV